MKTNKINDRKRGEKKEIRSTIKNLPSTIIDYLKESNKCDTYQALAKNLSVKLTDINNFKSGSSCGKPAVKKFIDAIVNHSVRIIYKPILELQPIRSNVGGNMCIGNSEELDQWKEKLNEQGIYLFYDSMGKAIYAGRTNTQSLWSEMSSALTRKRKIQKLYKYNHGQIKKQPYCLYEVAHYVSAYAVHKEAIKDFEALIIRAFPNDLTNVRMERKTLSFDNGKNILKKKGRK